jgi:hypothetical protein
MYEKRIVCQVGYLQELNRDAWSTEHKILGLFKYCGYCALNFKYDMPTLYVTNANSFFISIFFKTYSMQIYPFAIQIHCRFILAEIISTATDFLSFLQMHKRQY